jgi:hypothetical protein
LSLTFLMPTFRPANTVLRMILRFPMQIRPQQVTVMVRSCKGKTVKAYFPRVLGSASQLNR